MKSIILLKIIFICLSLISIKCNSQDTSSVKKSHSVKTIWDIPHKTFREKWMWIHRSFAFKITKTRPVKYDTAYIKSNYKRLVITLPLSARFLKFSLIDLESGNRLNFFPNLQTDLGLSISSRWASFILNSGIKIWGEDNKIKGKTKFQDYQLNLYGRKITTDMFVQYYEGFYIRNSKSYNNYLKDKPFALREDVYALNIGVSSYYIVNHRKFSFGNSFAFVEQQKKSAGSLLLGIYYSYFTVNGSPSLVSPPFRSNFDTLSLIRSGQTHNFGLNLGYIYTLVFLKKCYVTAGLVQGIGGKHVTYRRDDNSIYNQLIGGTGKLHLRGGLGYDQGRYFIGAMCMFDYFLLGRKASPTFEHSYGKTMIYVGYRFSVLKAERKLLRRLKLIDY